MIRIANRVTRLMFETDDFIYDTGQQRRVIVEARPAYAKLRLKGTRRSYSIPYSAVYQAAVRMDLDANRRLKVKKAAKKGGRK